MSLIYKLYWAFDRWRIMDHPREELYRISQQIQYRVTDRRWYAKPPVKGLFKFSDRIVSRTSWSVDGLRNVVLSTKGDIHRFPILNRVVDDIVNNTRWNHDFKTGVDGQTRFVHDIDDFDESSGEVKYLYELSRMHQIPVLAAVAVATGDDKLLKLVESQLRRWSEQNPFLATIGWKSGNEVGIRAINLVYYRMIVALSGRETGMLDKFLDPLIELHYKFLKTHLSLFSSKGNHHIGELAAIIAICANYSFPGDQKTLENSFEELCSETLRLIHPDGFNTEQATRYQVTFINLIVTAFEMCRLAGFATPPQVRERIRAMYDFLDALKIDDRQFFHIGDDDNAELIFPYFDPEYDSYESMLNDRAVLFSEMREPASHFDLRNYLLFGDEGRSAFGNAPVRDRQTVVNRCFSDSGYFIYKDNDIQMLFDVGRIGLLPSMCHGHADILNLIVYINRRPVIVDCGSYQYNSRYRKLRDYFHGTLSHNTISVDSLDQAQLGSGMFWMSDPEVEVISFDDSPEVPSCEATHNGYVQRGCSTKHVRKVGYSPSGKKLTVKDYLTSKGDHTATFRLHFHPSVKVIHDGDKLIVNDNITIENALIKKGKLVKGDESIPLGWYSEKYDAIEPTTSFSVDFKIDRSFELITEIKICAES